MKDLQAVIEWFKANGAEPDIDYGDDEQVIEAYRIEAGNGCLELSVPDRTVYVYSGLGTGDDYGFKLRNPSIQLLSMILAQGDL